MTQVAALHEFQTLRALRLTVRGRVQGMGLRPALSLLAHELELAGWIANTGEGVEIHVEGTEEAVERFGRVFSSRLPAPAAIESLRSSAEEPRGLTDFVILSASDIIERQGPSVPVAPLVARVPVDSVVCKQCLDEIRSPDNRRFGYPFTSCTSCGPRYSIIEAMPYERSRTTMSVFEFCPQCTAEYDPHLVRNAAAPARRFHAQTNACADCGPRAWLLDSAGRSIAQREGAMRSAAAAIGDGKVVALKGLGGYQLLADAASPAAVARLRNKKGRRDKPLAVMVASVEEAGRLAFLDEGERRLLSDPLGPIVIVKLRANASLAPGVSEGFNTVGLMLPTTPLHALLVDNCRTPLVVTSGNREGEPLAYRYDDERQLENLADCRLEHDRPIRRPVDDSVVRIMAGRAATIRLGRGMAPLSLMLDGARAVVALGGHQKTAIALANGRQAVLGPHLGDLDTLAMRERYVEQFQSLRDLYGVPDDAMLAVDEHPDYFTSQWGDSRSASVARVQHHHAHIAAGMLEHGWLDREVLGVAFDGAGFGPDGTIWGGEFLLTTPSGCRRVGHLHPFRLPGGDRAAREPWRVAMSLVLEAAGAEAAARLSFATADARTLLPLISSPRLSPVATSAGRLFDGVAALVLGIERSSFEGQPAMLLEAACDPTDEAVYPMPCGTGMPSILDWRPMIERLLHDRSAGVSPGRMAMRFHRGLAFAAAELCRRWSPLPIVLGGGVFQNRALVELMAEGLGDGRQQLGLPGFIPVNDGGLAAGQLAIALANAS